MVDESTRLPISRIVDHEFRDLSTGKTLTTMSAFDLIDHCSQLFEKLVILRGTQRGLRSYVRAYLIFSYFITTFIMVHFEGFARFMESSHADFVIYLNLYDFFRSDKVLQHDSFSTSLSDVRRAILEYLQLKQLLTFDVAELYGWLDEYVAYLRDGSDHKGQNGTGQNGQKGGDQKGRDDGPATRPAPKQTADSNSRNCWPSKSKSGFAGYPDDEESLNDLDDFSLRFPEIPEAKTLDSAPYPVQLMVPLPQASQKSRETSSSSPYMTEMPPEPTLSEVTGPFNGPVAFDVPVPKSGATQQVPKYSSFHPLGGTSNGPSRPPPPLPPVHSIPSSYPQSNGYPAGHGERKEIVSMEHSRPDLEVPLYSRHPVHPGQHTGQGPPEQMKPRSWNTSSNFQASQYQSQQPLVAPNTHGPALHKARIHNSMQRPHQRHDTAPRSMVPAASHHHSENRMTKTQWMHANHVCGLKNLGSSCYINLTIQMLVGLERFNELFYTRAGEWFTSSKKNTLAESTSSLVATFNSNGGANIAPTKFLKVLARLKPDFNIPNEQQDAQEILLFLLDKLHEDLAHKPTHAGVDYISKWGINVNSADREKYLEWYRGLIEHEGESEINDMCQGHVQNKLICNKCGFSSISYSPFSILSLPIPHANREGVDLTDCLRYYTQDEVLSGENAWNCPKCNKSEETRESPMDVVFEQKRGLFRFSRRSKSPSKKQAAAGHANTISIKQLSFIKLPPVLFIHLSRFHMFNLTDKLDTDIAYPFRLLFNRQDHEMTYNLRGLVNHYGNLNGGHYTSIVKKSPRKAADGDVAPVWCSFDDDHVRINVPCGQPGADGNKVHSRDVYVLCYERV